MKFESLRIWDALKEYVKSNPIRYLMNGKEITPKNFNLQAPDLPFSKGDYGDEFNFSIKGICLFDHDVYLQKPHEFDCIVCIKIIGEKEIVTKIKDGRIYIK